MCRTVSIAESFARAEKNCLSLRMEAVRPSKRRNPLAQRHSVTPQRNWYFKSKYVHEEVKGTINFGWRLVPFSSEHHVLCLHPLFHLKDKYKDTKNYNFTHYLNWVKILSLARKEKQILRAFPLQFSWRQCLKLRKGTNIRLRKSRNEGFLTVYIQQFYFFPVTLRPNAGHVFLHFWGF